MSRSDAAAAAASSAARTRSRSTTLSPVSRATACSPSRVYAGAVQAGEGPVILNNVGRVAGQMPLSGQISCARFAPHFAHEHGAERVDGISVQHSDRLDLMTRENNAQEIRCMTSTLLSSHATTHGPHLLVAPRPVRRPPRSRQGARSLLRTAGAPLTQKSEHDTWLP